MFAGLENGEWGRDAILRMVGELSATPAITDVKAAGTTAAAAAVPRSALEGAQEVCGRYWQSPLQSEGYDAARERAFGTLAGGDDTMPLAAAVQLLPYVSSRLGREQPAAMRAKLETDGGASGVVSTPQWRAATAAPANKRPCA